MRFFIFPVHNYRNAGSNRNHFRLVIASLLCVIQGIFDPLGLHLFHRLLCLGLFLMLNRDLCTVLRQEIGGKPFPDIQIQPVSICSGYNFAEVGKRRPSFRPFEILS